MWNGINRRKFPRANYQCTIVIKKRLNAKTISTQTENIGAGGILLVGPIPDPAAVTELLLQKAVIGVRIFLPGEEKPVEALARVAWLEAIDQNEHRCSLGLMFKEITSDAQDTLFRFIISSRMG